MSDKTSLVVAAIKRVSFRIEFKKRKSLEKKSNFVKTVAQQVGVYYPDIH